MPAPLRWTILAPGLARPAGGLIALFELANELARRGELVELVHLATEEARVRRPSDIPWMRIDDAVAHRFADDLDPDGLPSADVLLYSPMTISVALHGGPGAPGVRFVDELRRGHCGLGLPVLLYQGRGVFSAAVEQAVIGLPGPKVCVGRWLAEHLALEGVPASDIVHIPNGVDHSTFRVRRPIATRAPHVSMNYDPHPVKAGDVGLDAIERAQRRREVAGTVFATRPPSRPLRRGIDLVRSPGRAALAEIYNASSIYLQPSRHEGFGMCAVESMACGCALVTTDNGGSAEYAHDGETAIVCGGDPAEMADALTRLCDDDRLRSRIATNGAEYVQRFLWPASAARLLEMARPRVSGTDPAGGCTP